MASSTFLAFHFLLLILLLLASEPATGFRASLTRVDSRPKHFTTEASLIKSSLKADKDVYLMSLTIGTPPVEFSAVMDTGSDLIWTKCKETSGSPFLDSINSKSYSKLNESCEMLNLGTDCKQTYADHTSVSVTLGRETLTIGNNKIKNAKFACGKPNGILFDGVVGMGRGELSLVSQLQERVFSYCLGSRFGPKTSSMLLAGSEATSINTNTQTMPLIKIKQGDNPRYYISLEGISVGETKLAVTKSDFAVYDPDKSGMIIDSGTTFTYLEKRIVDMISSAFMNQTKLEKRTGHSSYDLKHCFKPPAGNASLPKMVFHFEGANWELPKENYMYQYDGTDMACLAFIANVGRDLSIFGNMQQQNMLVVYDLDSNSLSFKPANCNHL